MKRIISLLLVVAMLLSYGSGLFTVSAAGTGESTEAKVSDAGSALWWIEGSDRTGYVGQSINLALGGKPEGRYTWTSSNENLVQLTPGGDTTRCTVQLLQAGETVITVSDGTDTQALTIQIFKYEESAAPEAEDAQQATTPEKPAQPQKPTEPVTEEVTEPQEDLLATRPAPQLTTEAPEKVENIRPQAIADADAPVLTLGETMDFTLDADECAYAFFTPAESGIYRLDGPTGNSFFGFNIFDSNDVYIESENYWDDGVSFYLTTLEAGETYQIEIWNWTGTQATAAVCVTKPNAAEDFTLDYENLSLYWDDTESPQHHYIYAYFSPSGCYSELQWESDNEEIVKIQETSYTYCCIEISGPGTATVTATDENGTVRQCRVVIKSASPLALDVAAPLELPANEIEYFLFTPDTTGFYTIVSPVTKQEHDDSIYTYTYSFDICDTDGYDYHYSVNTLMTDDDYLEFFLLDAGTEYRVNVTNYEDFTMSGSMTITKTPAPTSVQLEEDRRCYWDGSEMCQSLDAFFTPADSLDSITWTSSNEDVVRIENTHATFCNYKIVGYGEATITAETAGGLQDSCTITVLEIPELPLGQSVDVTLKQNDWAQFYFTPAETATYSFFTPDIQVTEDYLTSFYFDLYDESGDYARYLFTSYDGGYTLNCYLEAGTTYRLVVNNPSAYTVTSGLEVNQLPPPDAISLNSTTHTVHWDGGSYVSDLWVSFSPSSTCEPITWTSSDESVIRIDWGNANSCTYEVMGYGTATVTAESISGLTASCTITVREKPALTLDEPQNVTINAYNSLDFSFTPDEDDSYVLSTPRVYTPECGTVNFYFQVFDPQGNPVESEASTYRDETFSMHYPLQAGTTYNIRVHNQYPISITNPFTVSKVAPPESIELDWSDKTINWDGEPVTYTMEAVFSPAGTFDKITWTSSNESVIAIELCYNASCNIKVLGYGEATITAVTDGGLRSSCTITVRETPSVSDGDSFYVELNAYDSLDYRLTVSESAYYGISAPYTPGYDEEGSYCDYQLDFNVYNAGNDWVSGHGFYDGDTYTKYLYLEAGVDYELRVVNPWEKPKHDAVTISRVPDVTGLDLGITSTTVYWDGSDNAYRWFNVDYNPADAFSMLEWTSSNEDVIHIVDGYPFSCQYQVVGYGEATVTVTATNGVSTQCTITVAPAPTLAEGSIEELTVTDYSSVNVTFTPESSGYYAFSVVSASTPSGLLYLEIIQDGNWVSTVTKWGTVRYYIAKLEAGIPCTLVYSNYNDHAITCLVGAEKAAEPTSVAFSSDRFHYYLTEGQTETGWINYEIQPANAWADVTITSSNESVAAVESVDTNDITVILKSIGTATLTASIGDQVYDTTEIIVEKRPELTALSMLDANGRVGETIAIEYLATPSMAVADCTFTVADPTVAVVEESDDMFCYVRLLKEGTTTLTATDVTGITASCTITVVAPTPISLGYQELLTISHWGDNRYYSFTPEASGSYVVHFSHNAGYASFCNMETGEYAEYETFYQDGVYCYAELEAGVEYCIKLHADAYVPVRGQITLGRTALPTSVSLGQEEMTFYYHPDGYNYLSLTAAFDPIGSFVPVHFSSSNPAVAMIRNTWQQNCSVAIVGTGTAVITATTDNGLSTDLTIHVEEAVPAESMTLTYPELVSADNYFGISIESAPVNSVTVSSISIDGTAEAYAVGMGYNYHEIFCETPGDLTVTVTDTISGLSATAHITVVEEGSDIIGKDLSWDLADDGTLTISGTGPMVDFPFAESAPWYDGRDSITRIVIEDGVTTIGSYAFADCEALELVTVSGTVTSVGYNAFRNAMTLKEISFAGSAPEIDESAFKSVIATVRYPAGDDSWNDLLERGFNGILTWKVAGLEAPVVKASNLASSGAIKLTWEPAYGAQSYQVYRAAHDSDDFTLADTVTDTTFTDTGLQAGKQYDYYVVSLGADGEKSAKSNVVSRTWDLPQPVVTASNVASSGKIKLTWNEVEGASGYKVYRATSKSGSYSLLKTITSASTTSFTNTGAVAGSTYYYKVLATHATSAANSAYSAIVSRACDLPRPVVTASNVASSGKIKLTWEEVEGASGYKIYRATSKSGSYSLLKTITSASTTSFTNTGAEAGATYYYKVLATHTKSAANSAYSSVVSRICDLAQPVVTASNVASSGKIKLTWEEVEGAVEYQVYRSTTGKDGSWTLTKTTTGTSYTNTSAKAGTLYYYKVRAIAETSSANSAYSAAVSRTCDLPQTKVTTSNVASSGKIKLTWEEVEGASGYKIYRSTSKTGTYSLLKTVTSGTTTSFTNTGAVAGTTYYYKVIATHTKSAANSAYSSIVSRTCDLARPVVTITLTSAGKPKLTWDAVDGAVSYKVYRATSKTGTYSLVKTATGTSYTNTSAKADTTYYYKVLAVHSKSAANSAYSTVKSVTTP